MTCTCPHIMLGSERTECRNWNPACEEHGWESEWYNSPEQTRIRLAAAERSAELQRIARARRDGTMSKEEALELKDKITEETMEEFLEWQKEG